MTKTNRKNYNKKFKRGRTMKINTCQAEGCDIPVGRYREFCVDHKYQSRDTEREDYD